MKSEIVFVREYGDASKAAKVMRAVSPDNQDAPDDTSIEMLIEGGSLVVKVASSADLPSFLRTIDDLLSCIQVAERTLLKVE
ncbi:MAG: hypothetical protein NO516_05195 [Candidatus Methanomethylicia archaeon]|nr:hypothetical protein [Candidatus Methanomethylicia archaeon]